MRAFWLLTRLRMAEIVRVPSTMVFFFVMPAVMLLVTAALFAGGQPYSLCRVGLVGDTGGPWALASEIRWSNENLEQGLARLRTSQLNALITRDGGGLVVLVGPRQRLLGDGLAAALPKPARVEVVTVPGASFVYYLCPGILALAVILSGLFGLGHSLARYRQSHFLRKLATTPLSKWTFIASQLCGRGLLVLLQGGLLLLLMALLGLPLSLVQVVEAMLICSLGLLVFLGLGFVLACFVRNEGVLADAINALGWPLVLGSEIFFPSDVLPGPLPVLAGWLPSTELVRLLRGVLLGGPGERLVGMGELALWAVLAFALGGLLFDWTRLD
ncbi:MAG: ABC transporter permease [Vulcanimicrobiota bacterium]